MDQEQFGILKLTGFASCFLIVALMQWFFPYRKIGKKILANWSRNLPLAFVNAGLMSLVCAGCVCLWSVYLQENKIGLFNFVSTPIWLSMALAIVLLDAVAYFWHRMNHKFSWLWRFHSVHHTDRVFDASTAVRFHIGELLTSLGIRLLTVTIFGLSVPSILLFELIFQFFNIFEHGNVRLPLKTEGIFAKIFVTPALHRKHHSIQVDELNTNFGTIFSFWDRLGVSYRASDSQEHNQTHGLHQVRFSSA